MNNKIVKYAFYPLLQYAAGRKQVFKTLAQLEHTQWCSPAEIKELQLAKLKSLVDDAYHRIPYYRKRFEEAGVKPTDINSLEDIRKLPVLQKNDVQENLALMVDQNFKGKLSRNTTSGSTGQPLVFYEDGRKNTDSVTEYLRFLRWYGVDIGTKEARLIRLERECQNNKTNLSRKMLLNQLMLPGEDLSEETLEDNFKKIDSFKPKVLFGITSTLFMFTQYLLDKGKSLRNIRLDLVVAWAAPLYPYQRTLMEATYNCPVADLYGTREVGHIAGECSEKGLHINEENLLVEVENSGKPCRTGEAGSILVTTLNQYCMPFIRYNIEDVGILDGGPCSCGRGLRLLREVVGRTGEILTTPSGKKLAPTFWCSIITSASLTEHIKQFKVIQRTKTNISIQLVRRDSYNEEHTRLLRRLLAEDLGDDINVDFEFVDQIPPDKSGKYKIVVSELPDGKNKNT